MSYYKSKSKSRWVDPFARAKSGIACISSSEVYSLHKRFDLSHVTSSIGKLEEITDLEDEITNLQEEIKQPICSDEEQSHNTLLPDQQVPQEADPLGKGIESLKDQVFALQENKQEQERQLLMYQALKDQESTLKELQIVIEGKTAEIELLVKMIESLERENRRLKDLAVEREKLKSEIELAKIKMKETRKQIQKSWRKKKDAMIKLCQQLAALRARVVDMLSKEEEMKKIIEGLRGEITELRRANLELVNDKIELLKKMDSITEGMGVEKEAAEKALEEASRFRIANGELAKQVEMYRSDRQADVQELIYLRWINACLRYELQKKHRPRGRNASSINNEKGGNMVGLGDDEKRSVGYDTDCSSTTEAETIDSSRDLGTKKIKKAKPKLIDKIKKWGDTNASTREVNSEQNCRNGSAGGTAKAKTSPNGHAKRIIAFCGKMDYVTNVRVLPRSRSMLVNATLCTETSAMRS